jgi:hypothetical protein
MTINSLPSNQVDKFQTSSWVNKAGQIDALHTLHLTFFYTIPLTYLKVAVQYINWKTPSKKQPSNFKKEQVLQKLAANPSIIPYTKLLYEQQPPR